MKSDQTLAEIMTTPISDRDALVNVARIVLAATETKRMHNGRARGRTYVGCVDEIAQAARRLAEMVLAAEGQVAA